MGEQEPFSYRTTSEHPLTTSSLATPRGRSQMAQGTWHPGPLLRTQGTGGRAWDRCGDSCALLASSTRSPTSRVHANNVWGASPPGCQHGEAPPHLQSRSPQGRWNGWASSSRPIRTSGPKGSATQPCAPPGHRDPRAAAIARSSLVPTGGGRSQARLSPPLPPSRQLAAAGARPMP